MSIKCPKCGLYNPDNSIKCDCGFKFQKEKEIGFGYYYLNQNFYEVSNDAEEISAKGYATLPRTFKDEKIFNARNIRFLNCEWNSIIGVTHGKIYKISLQIQLTGSDQFEHLLVEVTDYFKQKYGQNLIKNNIFIWDTDFGNVIVSGYIQPFLIINISLTSNTEFKKIGFSKSFLLFLKSFLSALVHKMKLKGLIFNPLLYTDEQNELWCRLRVIEWSQLPLYSSQIIVPILLCYYDWWKVILVVFILNWLWIPMRYRYFNIAILSITPYITRLKWLVSIVASIVLIIKEEYFLSIISITYPFIVIILSVFRIPFYIGRAQNILMKKIGYTVN